MALPRLVSYDKILRGKIFNVAIPFTSARPLDFVVENKNNKGLFNLVPMDDGFLPVYSDKLKRKVAPTIKAVCEFKMRPAVVIQKNEYNSQHDYHQTIVLPIASIYPEDKNDEVIQQMISKNDIEHFHYLGDFLDRESFVVIYDPKRVHKNMLFETKKEIFMSDPNMEIILEKFAQCFEIARIKECDECERNCDKCEYRLAVNK